jgi:peroxiredoxin
MKYLLIPYICLFFCTGITTAQTPSATIPGFTFYKFDKTLFENKNLATGKFLFFAFFDATCDHCQHAIEYINTHQQEFKNTAMYLITLDNKNTVATFMGKHGKNLLNKKNILMLQDTNNEFVAKFGPKKYPSLFLYSSKQKILLYSDDEKGLHEFSSLTNTAKQ